MFFLNFVRSLFFFTLGTRLRISKFCVDLCKKSDRTRCLAVSIIEYNINWNSKSADGFLKEEQFIGSPRRANIGDPAYRIV